MLSHCAPFTNRLQYAEKQLGGSIHTLTTLTAITGEVVTVDLVGTDSQDFTDWKGETVRVAATNVREMFVQYHLMYPQLTIKELTVAVSCGDKSLSEIVPCVPLNPELVATVARKLLRKLYGYNPTV